MDLLKEIDKVHFNLKVKNYEIAISKCNKLIKLYPNNSYLYNLCGIALQQFKQIKHSVKYFQKSIDLEPKNLPAKNNLANSLKILGNLDIAEKLYNEILKQEPKYLKCLNNYANLKQQLTDYDGAIKLYNKALEIEPNNIQVLMSLATAYQSNGEFENTLSTSDKILNLDKSVMSAHKLKSGIINYKNNKKHLNEMLEIAKNSNLSDSQKIDLFFAIGKAFEDISDYDKSFDFYEQANKIKNNNINFNISSEIDKFENIKEIFKNIDFKNFVKERNDTKIIFICGMPRSGTTLIEQIIASHKNVSGAGELIYLSKSVENNFSQNNKLKKKILEEDIFSTRSKLSDDYFNLLNLHKFKDKIITDKAPQNFRWLGFIRIFFPNSKIIHCRRNPKDICLSLYKNSFASTDMNWSYSQENIANYYNLYSNLIEFWKNKIGDHIYDINYEKLVSNKDDEVKNLLKFCELKFDANCLNHHKIKKTPIKTVSVSQARQAIYTSSVDKNKFYENNLNKMFSLLE